ncbi:hypothetical protein FC70_GL001748 [Paucilactobacillus oligofermentans DSM 15707 = LMG 22743]|uniref:Siphovirus-type tail component RIFT-related domain-containing protein n=1 Tax=Paucilactobacillus oligofermentans DSM 15707 = LMG 22743 TaxID=1423778 RepID=A0A0R1REC1_9LACO|nr:phage tail domain-containing protein [Paucilactobacillus oligofermentans]KRL54945.1 hypothetical protein FC70_GL001748 [Paucilactobacillus oligofermentans DSM 15707 = LMG 22743]CUS26138.1 Phage minor tail protein [Paucilactobacillus oligofermentans DSM 15707 = LMG 22743]
MIYDPRLYIKIDDEDEIDVSEQISGLKFLGDDENPNPLITYQADTGVDGQLPLATTFDKNVINANFWLHFKDYYDFKIAKHDIHRIFSRRSKMRIRTDAEPDIVKFVRPVPFEISITEPGGTDSMFTIPFDNPSGYKYSLGRSDDDMTYHSAEWQIGMNIPIDQILSYKSTSSEFEIYNASDIVIDPYLKKHDLKILVKFVGDGITITNKTNGTNWSYIKAATKNDSIILNGIATTLNGEPASANTDFGNIVLEQGYNDISVTGAADFEIAFSFPFVYLG